MNLEIFSEILDSNIRKIEHISRGKLWFYKGKYTLLSFITEEELYFKIKEWALKNDFSILTGYKKGKYNSEIYVNNEKIKNNYDFSSDTEIGTIIKSATFISDTIKLLESDLV